MSSTSTITKSTVKHIGELAKLPLSGAEIDKFEDQLSSALEYVGILEKVDTSNVGMPPQITGLKNVFREDVITPSLSQEDVLKNAKRTYKGYFVVNAVFEE